MQFLDFLAFIASMILFVYLSRKKKETSEDDLEENDQNSTVDEPVYSPRIRTLMNKLNVSEEEIVNFENQIKGIEKKKYKKVPPALNKDKVDVLQKEDFSQDDDFINPYAMNDRKNRSKASALIHGAESKKKMILFHIIFDKPPSLKS